MRSVEERDELIERNARLITYFMRKYLRRYPAIDHDDMYEIILWSMLNTAAKWDESKCSFANWMDWQIRSNVSTHQQQYQRNRHLDLDSLTNDEDGDEAVNFIAKFAMTDPKAEAAFESVLIDELVERVLEALSIPRDKEIFLDLYYGDKSRREIAIERGISRQALQRASDRIKRTVHYILRED